MLAPASPQGFHGSPRPPLRSRDILESFPGAGRSFCVSLLTDAGCGVSSPPLAAASERGCCVRVLLILPPDALRWPRCLEAPSAFPLESKLLMASAAAARLIIQG